MAVSAGEAGGFLPGTFVTTASARVWNDGNGAPVARGTNATGPFFSYTTLDHFGDSYKFHRGGYRLKSPFEPALGTPNVNTTGFYSGQAQWTITQPRQSAPMDGIYNIPGSTVGGSFPTPCLPVVAYGAGPSNGTGFATCGSAQLPIAFEVGSGCNLISVEVPYRSDALYQGTGASVFSGSGASRRTAAALLTGDNSTLVRIQSSSQKDYETVNATTWYRSAADDFRFLFIKCLKPSIELFSVRMKRSMNSTYYKGIVQYALLNTAPDLTGDIVYF